MNKVEKVLISGNFNILHPGHLRLFMFARELGYRLIVGINSDLIAGHDAHLPESFRLDAVNKNSLVDEAFIIFDSISNVIERLKPDIVIKGKEHENRFNPELEALSHYGGKLIFSSGELNFSSFDLIQKELNISKNYFSNIPPDYLKRHELDISKIIEKVNKFNKLRVLVIGDLIIDEYISCEALGMSQEDPTIVVKPIESKKYIGGAGIVAAHAAGLGADVSFLTVTGFDDGRNFAENILNASSVKTELYIDESRPTTLKQRFRCNGKTLLRVSNLHQGAISVSIQKKLIEKIKNILTKCDLLIFSDFNYGCLPNNLVAEIVRMANEKNLFIVADSQSSSQIGDITRFKNMSLITPTEREARISLRDQENGLVVLAEKLKQASNAQNILIKVGEQGVIINSEVDEKNNIHTDRLPALNLEPVDVAGAGDSMLVTAALSLASGSNIWEASLLGSLAAAVQVGRIGNIPLRLRDLVDNLKG